MKIKLSKSQWSEIGTKAGWNKKAQTSTIQFENRGDQLVGISDWITINFSNINNITPQLLHKLNGYAEQIGIIGEEIKANKVNVPGVRPR